ncbi:hypothetical protein EDC01DRAFT_761946 [Geopyxis carbonaria]|nr:hypothetical protein EDC01DRAFT_761946 [Geopyxis carbonaria]
MKALLLLLTFTLTRLSSAEPCNPTNTTLTPLPNSISTPFALEIQAPASPAVHLRRMNFWKAGGGDNHLYLSPAGNAISNHTLIAGVLTNTEPTFGAGGVVIRAVINGEYTPADNTTKIFFTQRGDPRAYLNAYAGCNATSGEAQTELALANGGDVCVRPASGERWEFRYSGVGNTRTGVKGCVVVRLGVVFAE